jgi:hypothetical protein
MDPMSSESACAGPDVQPGRTEEKVKCVAFNLEEEEHDQMKKESRNFVRNR